MIWKTPPNLAHLQELTKGNLLSHLNIAFTAFTSDSLSAQMTILAHHLQPMGILHGGASCVLIETLGSVAANLCVDPEEKTCVGLEINVNHLRPVHSGVIQAIAIPLHLGKTTQVWDVQVKNEEGKRVAVGRLTVAVIDRREISRRPKP